MCIRDRGIPGRTGTPQGAQGHYRACRDIPVRTGASQCAQAHPRAHKAPQGAQGIPGRTGGTARAHGGTAGRARTLQGAQGIPGARRRTLGRRAAREGCQQPKKGPFGRRPKGAKEPFFASRKKFQIFWQKQLTNPYVDGNIYLAPALVAQLDRVSDYESEGREFESLSLIHI